MNNVSKIIHQSKLHSNEDKYFDSLVNKWFVFSKLGRYDLCERIVSLEEESLKRMKQYVENMKALSSE